MTFVLSIALISLLLFSTRFSVFYLQPVRKDWFKKNYTYFYIYILKLPSKQAKHDAEPGSWLNYPDLLLIEAGSCCIFTLLPTLIFNQEPKRGKIDVPLLFKPSFFRMKELKANIFKMGNITRYGIFYGLNIFKQYFLYVHWNSWFFLLYRPWVFFIPNFLLLWKHLLILKIASVTCFRMRKVNFHNLPLTLKMVRVSPLWQRYFVLILKWVIESRFGHSEEGYWKMLRAFWSKLLKPYLVTIRGLPIIFTLRIL
jgi:hypothetical protein